MGVVDLEKKFHFRSKFIWKGEDEEVSDRCSPPSRASSWFCFRLMVSIEAFPINFSRLLSFSAQDDLRNFCDLDENEIEYF